MICADCRSLLSKYKAATKRYADLTEALTKMAAADLLRDAAFQSLKEKVMEARLGCQMAKEVLRVHKESHGRLRRN